MHLEIEGFYDFTAQGHWFEFSQINSHWKAQWLSQILWIAATADILFSSNTLKQVAVLFDEMKWSWGKEMDSIASSPTN